MIWGILLVVIVFSISSVFGARWLSSMVGKHCFGYTEKMHRQIEFIYAHGMAPPKWQALSLREAKGRRRKLLQYLENTSLVDSEKVRTELMDMVRKLEIVSGPEK